MLHLTTAPIWISAVLFVIVVPVASMLGPVLIRRVVPLERLRTNNEVAGFKFATIGVLYAVLLAFVVIVVWEKFSKADDEVATEAGATAILFRLWDGLGEQGDRLNAATAAYLVSVINDEWPAMAEGHESPATTEALNGLYALLLTDRPTDGFGSELFSEALYELDQLTQARRARIVMAGGIVPGVVWAVLVAGGLLTIGFTFFFGTENLRAQALMTGALALQIFIVMLIIVAIDRPFAGTVTVEPLALADVLADFRNGQR